MHKKRRMTLLGLLSGAALVAAGSIDYNSFSVPERAQASRVAANPLVVEHAKELLGIPYDASGLRGVVCTDVYVRSAGVAKAIKEDAEQHPEHYSAFNERLPTVLKNARYLTDTIGISGFENTPENPEFTRRIQNVLSFQIAQNTFFTDIQEVEAGCNVYFEKGLSQIPTHMGVISEVNDTTGIWVIHASSREGNVISEPIGNILRRGYTIRGYGYTRQQ